MHKRILLLALLTVSIVHGMQSNNTDMVQVPREHYQAVMALLDDIKKFADRQEPDFYRKRPDGARVDQICLNCDSFVGRGRDNHPNNTCRYCGHMALFLHKDNVETINRLKHESIDILKSEK